MIDAHHRTCRFPIAKILIHCCIHAISITHISKIFRNFHYIGPACTNVIEDGLYSFHSIARLVFNPVRVIVFPIYMWMFMIEG